MRRITFWLLLLFIFCIPWEDSILIASLGSLVRVIGFVVAGFWILTILIEHRIKRFHIFHFLVLLFFLWNILSMLWSENTTGTMVRIKTYAQMFMVMLIFWEMFQSEFELIDGMQAYVLGAYVSMISLILNYIHGVTIGAFEARFSATGVNAVDLTLLLVLGLPFAWRLYIFGFNDRKNPILALLNLCYIPLAVFSAILTGSRTALIVIVPTIIYILRFVRTNRQKVFLFLVILIVSSFIIYPLIPESITQRLSTIFESFRRADLGGRVSLWWATLSIFIKHPIFGSGAGTLRTIIGADTHNTFLSIMAETGIIGFTLFLIMLLCVFAIVVHLPNIYSWHWITVLSTWVIGVSSLSWEFRKPTWLLLSLIVIESSLLQRSAYPMTNNVISVEPKENAFELKRPQKNLPSSGTAIRD